MCFFVGFCKAQIIGSLFKSIDDDSKIKLIKPYNSGNKD